MRIHEGGTLYGFCPAKATWDRSIVSMFNTLLLCYEMKTMLYPGAIVDQPGWFVDLLAWFITRYDDNKFYSRAKSILGGDDKNGPKGSQPNGNNSRTARR